MMPNVQSLKFFNKRPTPGQAVREATAASTPLAEPTAEAQVPAPADGTAVHPDFVLPEDGPPPDGTDPEAMRLYEERKKVHAYMRELDSIYSQAHPGRDFKAEYASDLAELEKSKAEAPGQGVGHGIARGLAKLASFNPANKGALEDFDAQTAEAKSEHDKGFAQRMMLRNKMHESAAAEAEAKGNWKAALKERETLALMKADEESLKHQREMERDRQLIQGRADVANIKAEQALRTAKLRAGAIAGAHGLKGSALDQFNRKVAEHLAEYFGPQNLMKDYSISDLDILRQRMEDWAELLDNNPNTPPPSTAPKPAAGPPKKTKWGAATQK